MNLVQTVVESADPAALRARSRARSAAGREPADPRPTRVLLIECLYDELVANEAGEAWAREAGLLLASPNVGVELERDRI